MNIKTDWPEEFLTILFIVSLYLTVLEIDIYRNTLIPWYKPTLAWLLTGLILTPVTSNFLDKYMGLDIPILKVIYSVATWGGLVLYAFMASNYYFHTDKGHTLTTKMIHIDHLAKGRSGCGNPYCDVVINNIEKEIIFPCGTHLEDYEYIQLTLKKGLWGIEIITDKKLVNN